MDRWQIIALLLTGVVLLVASVLLRIFTNGKYDIRTIDLVFIIVPLLIFGLATGKLRGLDLFGVKADLSDLWGKAADTQIESQISIGPVSLVDDAIEFITTAEKRGVSDIPRLIEQRTQALAFRLGMGGYDWRAIKKYFDDLFGSSYLRYVIVNRPDDVFFGMYDAADLIAYLRTTGEAGYRDFEQMLNRSNEPGLARLPGFVPSERAVTATTSKHDALEAMETFGLDSLPVKGSDGRLVGTVERSKLTAGLILAVTRKLSGEQKER